MSDILNRVQRRSVPRTSVPRDTARDVAAGPFGKALKKFQSGKPGGTTTNPAILRDRAARLRARETTNRSLP